MADLQMTLQQRNLDLETQRAKVINDATPNLIYDTLSYIL